VGRQVSSERHSKGKGENEVVFSEEQSDEIVLTEEFPPGIEPAHVRFGAGLTINLQNFESLRLDCAVSLPCLPSEVGSAVDKAADMVAEHLAKQEQLWTGKTR
jgi:hypothetical protein